LVSIKGIIIVRIAEIFSYPPYWDLCVAFAAALPFEVPSTTMGEKDAATTTTPI
jgi:hypothetical protein